MKMEDRVIDDLPNAPMAMPRQVLEPQGNLLGWFNEHLVHFWRRAENH